MSVYELENTSVFPTKKRIIAVSSDAGNVELQIKHPDGHISCMPLAEVAEAVTDFVDGKEWIRDLNESFKLLLVRLDKWVGEHNEVKHWFVVPLRRPHVFLFVVIQASRTYSVEFSLALSGLKLEVACDPRFSSFSVDVQEFPSINSGREDIVKMLQEYGD